VSSVTHLLFVCGRNRRRSPTAEALFTGAAGVETMSAGLSPDADHVLCADSIAWADVIFVMEQRQRAAVARTFARLVRDKRVVCLNIADDYEYMDESLVRLLRERVPRSVAALRG
jgi:predicted protein tyrosine phosphatase